MWLPGRCWWVLTATPWCRYNLSIGMKERTVRIWIGHTATFFLVFFYTIPVAFVQSMTNLETLSDTFPFLEPVLELSPSAKAWLQGFLPTLASTLFFEFLPSVLMCTLRCERSHVSPSLVGAPILLTWCVCETLQSFLSSKDTVRAASWKSRSSRSTLRFCSSSSFSSRRCPARCLTNWNKSCPSPGSCRCCWGMLCLRCGRWLRVWRAW